MLGKQQEKHALSTTSVRRGGNTVPWPAPMALNFFKFERKICKIAHWPLPQQF